AGGSGPPPSGGWPRRVGRGKSDDVWAVNLDRAGPRGALMPENAVDCAGQTKIEAPEGRGPSIIRAGLEVGMRTTIEATFDGQVFRPARPISLPPNTTVRLTVEQLADQPKTLLRTAR